MKQQLKGCLKVTSAILLFSLGTSQAWAFGPRGGGFRGGAVRVGAATSFRPGVGVTRSATVVAGRYHVPATLPAYRRGVAYTGAAVRTVAAVSVARNVMYRTAAGYSYYYGAPSYALPVPSCYAVMWEGMSAYSCNGAIYIYDNGQYFPIQGA